MFTHLRGLACFPPLTSSYLTVASKATFGAAKNWKMYLIQARCLKSLSDISYRISCRAVKVLLTDILTCHGLLLTETPQLLAIPFGVIIASKLMLASKII